MTLTINDFNKSSTQISSNQSSDCLRVLSGELKYKSPDISVIRIVKTIVI